MTKLSFTTACSTALLAASFSLCPGITAARAQVKFTHEFAPQDGLVAPVEKPFRDEMCLNGSWQFEPVALPSGYQQGKSPVPTLPEPTADGWEKTPLRIPSPWNVNAFPDKKGLGGDFRCYPSYPESWNDVAMGWMQRKFSIPSAWKGHRLLLHFAAVAGNAQIVVNGKTVGEHNDIFTPFDIDVTDAVNYGAENTILVGVRKSSLTDKQGKFGRRTYQGGSMWGQAIAGIWQDVFLEAIPQVHIANVFVKPQVDKDTLEAEVTVRNDTDTATTVNMSSDAYPWLSHAGNDMVSAPEPKWSLGTAAALHSGAAGVSVPAHESVTVAVAGKVNGSLKTWSPESPNLYGLVCRIKSASGTVSDSNYTRFGWRQISFDGSKVLLNGKQLVMKGDSWHFLGIPEMSRRYAWAWFKTLHDAHLNAVRLHAEPYPSFFLDVADEQGILVLDEDAAWASDGGPKVDDQSWWTDTETQLQNLILRDRNHPSVFGWSISNELMAVVRGVFHAPKELQDKVIQYDGTWMAICHKYDPTRVWISADGEDDGAGVLPTYVVHYGGSGALGRASKSGKPWGVGEAGPAYYGSPDQIAQQATDPRAYLSFADRMDGVALVSYQSLVDQAKYNASYRSVFNLVWYGLKPLELGMRDTTRPPAITDGVFLPPFVEGKPGVQPERLGPYCTTLNPGYDSSLPMYAPWPLFDAIKDAASEPPVEFQPARSLAFDAGIAKDPKMGTITSVSVLSGAQGTLAKSLSDLGVPVSSVAEGSSLIFVDGALPPSGDAKATIQTALSNGKTVFVWGVDKKSLDSLNAILPYPLELTDRTASSLVPGKSDPEIGGITPASLYFSELSPAIILPAGLSGPLIAKSKTLLEACNTDWMRWNRQPETTKTAMVLRSEREAKPSGVALAELSVGSGKLIVCNIPAAPQTSQASVLNRTLLGNLGIALGDGVAQRNTINARVNVVRALAIGLFPVATIEEALSTSIVAPNSGSTIVLGTQVKDHTWTPIIADDSGVLNLGGLKTISAQQSGIVYLSFWLYSPKALDNLLLDPHLPSLDLTIGSADAAQVWVNSKSLPTHVQSGETVTAPTLLLQQGWNHILVKVVRSAGANGGPSLLLQSNQNDYLTQQLRGAQEKP